MSKMYVYNVPADQTVRIRSTPSSKGKILVNVPFRPEAYHHPVILSSEFSAN